LMNSPARAFKNFNELIYQAPENVMFNDGMKIGEASDRGPDE